MSEDPKPRKIPLRTQGPTFISYRNDPITQAISIVEMRKRAERELREQAEVRAGAESATSAEAPAAIFQVESADLKAGAAGRGHLAAYRLAAGVKAGKNSD